MTKKPTELDLAVCLQLIPEEKEDGTLGKYTTYGYNIAIRETRQAFEDYFANNS